MIESIKFCWLIIPIGWSDWYENSMTCSSLSLVESWFKGWKSKWFVCKAHETQGNWLITIPESSPFSLWTCRGDAELKCAWEMSKSHFESKRSIVFFSQEISLLASSRVPQFEIYDSSFQTQCHHHTQKRVFINCLCLGRYTAYFSNYDVGNLSHIPCSKCNHSCAQQHFPHRAMTGHEKRQKSQKDSKNWSKVCRGSGLLTELKDENENVFQRIMAWHSWLEQYDMFAHSIRGRNETNIHI